MGGAWPRGLLAMGGLAGIRRGRGCCQIHVGILHVCRMLLTCGAGGSHAPLAFLCSHRSMALACETR